MRCHVVLPNAFVEAAERAERSEAALRRRTSLRVGGRPDFLFEPATEADAAAVIEMCREAGVPLRFLGGGYNLLVSDGRVEGAILATRRIKYFDVQPEQVHIGAGNSFPTLVKDAIELGIPGLPGCPGIPGTVGGVVFMNAGGRFGTVSDALTAVRLIDGDGNVREHQVQPGDLGYRRTIFDGCLVTGAVFRRDDRITRAEAARLYEEAMEWKRATQPMSAKSAGCIFKNPDGPDGPRSAGRLIDEAGLKGHELGGARISPVHANFIENLGGATALDVQELIDLVRERVRTRFGVELELEVRSW